jgi:glutathione S-transferase
MKLYDSGRAPNPRRVRIFLKEKGISVPAEQVDIAALAQRSDAYTAINPLQRVPALVLDDGAVITESIAICRYFEALQPEPVLFGRGAREQGLIEMWQRRMELNLLQPVASVFRHLHPAMKDLEVPQVAAWGEANKPRVVEFLALLDRELKDRRYAAGDDFSVADITGLVAVDFMKPAKLSVPPQMSNVLRWHGELSTRPSAAA